LWRWQKPGDLFLHLDFASLPPKTLPAAEIKEENFIGNSYAPLQNGEIKIFLLFVASALQNFCDIKNLRGLKFLLKKDLKHWRC